MDKNLKTTSFNIDKDLLIEFRQKAIAEEKTQTQVIIELITEYVNKDKTQTKLEI